ncbi:hypothetical protein GHT06_021664 [Daphnia sinensis]|uniref:Uncharacterized protein n=1 Tax=Daphnia sinensis TaxID=1820382 RepID=A0AAD5L9S9_9CRUS|nr:hypothetical protein GHT06_021664 [Daphnia sinensis]
MGIINETSYKTRRSNIILLALWYGNKKTTRSVFVDPCVFELKKLSSTGIQYDGVTYKIRPVIVTEAIRSGKTFNGIKGRTSLADEIEGFDFIASFIPEYMHCICLGVIRNLPEPYFSHFASLSYALSVLLQESVATVYVKEVGKLLEDFVRKMELLYDEKFFQNRKCLKIDGKSCLNLLGKQVRRKLTLDEQTIIENCLFQQNDEDIDENDREHIISIIENNSCELYKRLEFRNGSNFIFTTAAYVRSKKRINYCALLQDGSFFLIENFIFIEEGKCDFQVFIFGRMMGQEFKKTFCPSLAGKELAILPGQTTKLSGLGSLEAILPHQVVRKCVVAFYNSLLPSFIITALTNTLESD